MQPDVVITLLGIVVNNPQLQDLLAPVVGRALADLLPDASEDTIAQLLRTFIPKVADSLEAANPPLGGTP